MKVELLLAAGLFRSLSRWLTRSVSFEMKLVLFTIGAIAAAWLALHLWDRFRRQQAKTVSDPSSLFNDLCTAHGLSAEQSQLLRGLATSRQLAHPATLFVDPRMLREAAAQPGAAGSYQQLQRRLFGDAA